MRDQSFYDIIQPVIEGGVIGTGLASPEEIAQEREKLSTYRYEYLSVLVGMETFTGTGTSVKKPNLMLKKEEQHIGYMVVELWVQLITRKY